MSNVSLQHRHAAPRHCCHRLSASSTMAQTPPPHIPAACAALAPGRQVPARPGQTASCQVNRGKLLRARPGAAAGSQALYSRGRRCGHALPMPRPAPLTPSQWSGTPPPPRQTAWLPPSLVPAGVGGQGYGGAGDAETGWYLGRGGGGGARLPAQRCCLLHGTAGGCRGTAPSTRPTRHVPCAGLCVGSGQPGTIICSGPRRVTGSAPHPESTGSRGVMAGLVSVPPPPAGQGDPSRGGVPA